MDIKESRQPALHHDISPKPAKVRGKSGAGKVPTVVHRVQVTPAPALSVLRASDQDAGDAIGKAVRPLTGAPDYAPDYAPLSSARTVHFSAPPRLRYRLEVGLPQFTQAARKLATLPPEDETRLMRALELRAALKARRPQVTCEIALRVAMTHEWAQTWSSTLYVEALGHVMGSIPIAARMGPSVMSASSLVGFVGAFAGVARRHLPAPTTAALERNHMLLLALGILGAALKTISSFSAALDDDCPALFIPVLWMIGTVAAGTVHCFGARALHRAREGKTELQRIDQQIAQADALIDEMSFTSGRLKFSVSDMRNNSVTFAVDDAPRDAAPDQKSRNK